MTVETRTVVRWQAVAMPPEPGGYRVTVAADYPSELAFTSRGELMDQLADHSLEAGQHWEIQRITEVVTVDRTVETVNSNVPDTSEDYHLACDVLDREQWIWREGRAANRSTDEILSEIAAARDEEVHAAIMASPDMTDYREVNP